MSFRKNVRNPLDADLKSYVLGISPSGRNDRLCASLNGSINEERL